MNQFYLIERMVSPPTVMLECASSYIGETHRMGNPEGSRFRDDPVETM